MKAWERFLKVDGWSSGYPSVDRTLKHYTRRTRSESTKMNFCKALTDLCIHSGLEPEALVKLHVSEASRRVQDYVDSLADKGLSLRYVNNSMAYLKTHFKVNGYEHGRALKVEHYHQPARYLKRHDYVPTPEEIYRMAYAAGSARNKALILGCYQSGLRNSTLRALLYRDVREELEAGRKILLIPVYPEMKEVDPRACKGNIPYYTFFGVEASQALREYVEERKDMYGGIRDGEVLYCSDGPLPGEVRVKTPIAVTSIAQVFKNAARRADVKEWRKVRPKSMRPAYESALRNARLDVKDQEFLMGHILPGSQDPYYDKSKVEELRAKYSSMNFFPAVGPSDEVRKRAIVDFARLQGASDEEIRRMQEVLARAKDVDEAVEEIRRLREDEAPEEERIRRFKDPEMQTNGDGFRAKIIDEEELISYVEQGWEPLKELSEGRYLIRRVTGL